MMRKNCWAALVFGFCLQWPAAGMQNPTTPATKPEREAEGKKDPFAGFRWLDASGETHGSKFGAGQLSRIRPELRDLGTSEVESEVTRPDANSLRTTRRVYDIGPNGERVLIEVVVEDVRSTGTDALSATRTRSHRDVNGNLQVVRKEVQESAPAGPASYRTQTTIMSQDANGSLAPSEKIVQSERKGADGVVQIERTQQLINANRDWAPADRRVSTTREATGRLVTDESVYRPDGNGKLVLSQKDVSSEFKDPQGNTVQQREISVPNASGRFEVNERLSITRETYSDGSQRTTQTRFLKNAVAPSEGMKLVESITQTDTQAGSNATERVTAVQTPDVNGKLQTVAYTRAIEKK